MLSYTDPTAGDDDVALEDALGHETPSFTTGMSGVPAVTNNSTVDLTGPALVSATVNADGDQVELVFSEDLVLPASGLVAFLDTLAGSFSVTAAGSPLSIGRVSVTAGNAPHILTLPVSPDIGQGQAVVLSYTDPTAGDDDVALEDALGHETPSFTTGSGGVPAVTNNSTVTSTTAPALTSVTVTSTPHKTTDTYGAREHIEFSMTFDAPVTVTGDPTFAFDLGGASTATWYAGSGTTTLRFSHAVSGGSSGDRDTNGISWAANAIELNGGTIAGTDNEVAAILTHVAQPDLPAHKVDGRTTPVTPATVTVAVTSTPASADTYRFGETIVITVTASEAVEVEGDPEFEFSMNNPGGAANDVPATYDRTRSSATTMAFAYTVQAGDRDSDGIWIGNHSRTFMLDANDRIRTASQQIDIDRSHPEKGTHADHKVNGSLGAPTVPPDPTPPTLVSATATTLTIEWTHPGDGGSPLTRNFIEYRVEGTTDWTNWYRGETPTAVTRAVITNLQSATAYDVRVHSRNAIGNSQWVQSASAFSTLAGTAATGAPTITGTLHVGRTQTASPGTIADADGLTNASYSYQWIWVDGTDEEDISGATAATYSLTAAAVGKKIKVRASFTDDEGNAESRTSAPTATVEYGDPPTLGVVVGVGQGVLWWQHAVTAGLAFTHYEYRSSAGGMIAPDAMWQHVQTRGGGTSAYYQVVKGLTSGTTHTFQVRAATADVKGAPATVTATPLSQPSCTIDELGDRRLLWQGQLTAGIRQIFTDGTMETGYGTGGVETGTLTPDAFTFRSTSYSVYPRTYDDFLNIVIREQDINVWYPREEVLDALRLHVCNTPYDFSSATPADAISEFSGYQWDVGSPWLAGIERTLRLSLPPNHPATGDPVISGTVQEDEELTALTDGIMDEDVLDDVFTYQWMRVDADGTSNEEDITDALSRTYTLTDDDRGKKVKVEVRFVDILGGEETRTSAPTATLAGTPNTRATGAPTITGTAEVGQTLTASTTGIADANGLTSPTYTYQWIRVDGTEADIAAANSSTYTLVDADLGTTLKVRVSFDDDLGHTETLTSAATATVGATATAPTVSNVAVTSMPASGTTYYLAGEVIEFTVTFSAPVTVTATPKFAFRLGAATRQAAYASGSDSAALVFARTVQAGEVDRNGISWNSVALALDGGTITQTGATTAASLTHAAQASLEGHRVDAAPPMQVSASVRGLSLVLVYDEALDPASMPATGAYTVTATVGATTTNPAVSEVSIYGIWVTLALDAAPAAGATVTLAYAPPASNPVQDEAGNDAPAFSGQKVNGAAGNTAPTGAPTITGTAEVGETLTAVTTGIADADGLTSPAYTYQWIRVDGTEADIAGENSSTYTLVDADLGTTLKVRVSFTDDASNSETLTSAATATVGAAGNTAATGAPTITGTAEVGETLTAVTTGIADADGLTSVSYAYQWIRVNGTEADIAGENSTTYTLVDADLGTTLKVRVSFTDDAGNSETLTSAATATVGAAGNTAAPGAPTGLTATASGTTAIDLSWSAPGSTGGSAITGYKIEVSSDGGSSWSDLVANTSNTTTTYAHTGLASGDTRHYRVSAINTNGTGVPSNVDSATTGTSVPGAPTGLTATASGATQIDLSWSAPATTGGSAITGYKIEVSPDGSSWSDLVADTASTDTAYAHTGLTAGATRHYRVSAINTNGAGDPSNVANATTGATAPGAVWSATFTPGDINGYAFGCRNGDDDAECSNKDVLSDDTFTVGEIVYTVTEFYQTSGTNRLYFAGIRTPEDGTSWVDIADELKIGSTSLDIGDAFLSQGQNNTSAWRLRWSGDPGLDDVLGGDSLTDGTSISVTLISGDLPPPPPPTTPGAPTGLAATANGPSQIDLAWSAPASTGGSAITGYKIEVSPDGSSWSDLVADTASTDTAYAHMGLDPATTRHYRVSAINTNGAGVPSNVDSATTDATAPGAPTGLTATASGTTAIDLSWSAPGSTGGSAITGYKIEVSSDGGSSWSDLVANTSNTTTTYAHTGLASGDTRHYRVSAINTNGTGVPSNVDSATTDATAPGAPTGLTATASGTTAIDLSWSAPGSTGGSAITGYKIEVSSDGGSSWSDLVANTSNTTTTYAHTGLASGDTRHYRVSAINTNGAGVPSNVDSATTGTSVPGAPTGLTATASGTTAIDLSWSAPGSTGGSAITGYKIEVSSDGGSSWSDLVANTSNTTTTYAHTGLASGDTRHYRVSAINTNGTGVPSNVDSATTGTSVPGAPTGLTATASGTTAIDLSWSAPGSTGGSAITGYKIEVSSDGGSSWSDLVANTSNTTTTYAHTGLASGDTRHYRVSAINTNGTGVPSNVDSATTGTSVPGAPTGLTATASGATQIDLSWSAPASTGGSAITGYRIEVSPNGTSGWTDQVANTNSTATTYAHTGLAAGDTRHYRVSAINAVGTSDASDSDDTTTASPNTAATGAPTITGTAAVGQPLAVDLTGIADADGLTSVSYAYQWIRVNGTEADIAGENSSTYTLVDADLGTTLKVRVSFTDDAGNSETLTSAATATVGATATAPTVSNVAVTSTPASGTTYYLAGEAIEFTVTFSAPVTVTATPKFAFRLGAATRQAAYASGSDSAALVFARTVQAGEVDSNGISWNSLALALDGGTITRTGATTAARLTHAAQAPLEGHRVDAAPPMQVSASVHGMLLVLVYDEPLDPASMPATGAYTVTATVGATTTNPEVSEVSIYGIWVTLALDAAPAAGATVTLAYAPPASNPVQDEAGNDAPAFSGQKVNGAAGNTAPTGAPTITGTAEVGETLTAVTTGIMDADGLTSVSYAYQWIRVNGTEADIAGENSTTYTLVDADLGTTLKVRVSFTDDASNSETLTSAATATVGAAGNTAATGAPTITGTAEVGETLTAVTTGIADADGLTSVSYAYQWIRVNGTEADIAAANSTTYTLVDADLGTTLKVKVSFTDDAGNSETLTSAATATVGAAGNTAATGAPTITGTAEVGETLTAVTTGIADADGLTSVSYAYQWIRVNGTEADIAGENSTTYTLVDADLGTTLKVRVSFTDDAGNSETLTSAATATVGATATAPTVSNVAVTSTPASGTTYYLAGEAIEFTVTFSAPVTVTATPKFAFRLGAATRQAAYASGSDSAALVFARTVQAGEVDSNGISWNSLALALDGGTITRTGATTAARLTHAAQAPLEGHRVDAAPPMQVSASVHGMLLVLVYDEPLDPASMPATGAYTVTATVGATTTNPEVSEVSIYGIWVTLTLDAAPAAGATVTLAYAPPASNPVQDEAGNDAPAFSGQKVKGAAGNTADAGPDQTGVREGALVTLDGSGSSDPDDDPLRYRWNQISGEPVVLSSQNIVNPTFTAPQGLTAEAVLQFRLLVTDPSTRFDSDTVTVTVDPEAEPPPPEDRIYYFPHLAVGASWQTTITYINYSREEVTCQTDFISDHGSPLMVSFAELGMVDSRTDVLPPGGSVHQETDVALSAPLAPGWARATCTGPVQASLLFRWYNSEGMPVAEAGVNAATVPATRFVTFAEQGEGKNGTGVAYANPSDTAALVTFTVRDADGEVLAIEDLMLPPNWHDAQNMSPLFDLSSFTGSLEVTSTEPIVSLSLNFEAASGFSSLPPGELDASAQGSTTYYFPHLAVGASWQTTITYINYSPEEVTCQTDFISDHGSLLMVSFAELGMVDSRTDVLPPGGSVHQETDVDLSAPLAPGWALANCSGPVQASLLFRQYDSEGMPVAEAGVNAATVPATRFVTFAEQGEGKNGTAVAYANPSDTAALVTFTARDADGEVLAIEDLMLPPNWHGAQNMPTLFGLTSFTGSLEVTSTEPIVSLSLNFEADPVFSSLPPGELEAAAQ